MSDAERAMLELKVARIEALLQERQKQSDSNSLIIRTIALGMVIQVMSSFYYAGVKTQKLDSLNEQVTALSSELHQHPSFHVPTP